MPTCEQHRVILGRVDVSEPRRRGQLRLHLHVVGERQLDRVGQIGTLDRWPATGGTRQIDRVGGIGGTRHARATFGRENPVSRIPARSPWLVNAIRILEVGVQTRFLLQAGGTRVVIRGRGSQVVAGVGEVEALVGQREVGDDRVGEGDGQGRPVEEGRVDDLEPGERAVGVEFDAVGDGAAPAFDEPDSRGSAGPSRWAWPLAIVAGCQGRRAAAVMQGDGGLRSPRRGRGTGPARLRRSG